MPSKKRTSKRRSRSRRRSRTKSYKYNRRTNLLNEVSKSKIRKSIRRSSKRRSKQRQRASSTPRRSVQIRRSPRKLVDISSLTNRQNVSRGSNEYQRVKGRRYRLTVGGTPRKSRVNNISRKLRNSPRK